MKLTAKLVSALIMGAILLLAIDGYLSTRRDIKIFEKNMRKDARHFGLAARDLIIDVWRIAGQQRALELIASDNLQGDSVRIRWVWLDAKPDDPNRPGVSQKLLGPVVSGKEISLTQRDVKFFMQLWGYLAGGSAMHIDAVKLVSRTSNDIQAN